MSSSIKLQILRALDCTTRLKEGLDWFLGRHHLQVGAEQLKLQETAVKVEPGINMELDSSSANRDMEADCTKLTGYQRLLDVMMQKQVITDICVKFIIIS
jgi:hypothetical protein